MQVMLYGQIKFIQLEISQALHTLVRNGKGVALTMTISIYWDPPPIIQVLPLTFILIMRAISCKGLFLMEVSVFL